MRVILLPLLFALGACGASQPPLPAGTKADRIVVTKSQGWLTAYSGTDELVTFFHVDFGKAPPGKKRFEGDGRIPEGDYIITGRETDGRYLGALRISYPDAADRAYAEARGHHPGGDILIHGGSISVRGSISNYEASDGSIRLTDDEMAQLRAIVPDGTPITIQP